MSGQCTNGTDRAKRAESRAQEAVWHDNAPERCPVCGDEYRGAFRTSKIGPIKEGDFCVHNGVFIVHEDVAISDQGTIGMSTSHGDGNLVRSVDTGTEQSANGGN